MYDFHSLATAIQYPKRAAVELYSLGMKKVFGGNRGDYVMEQDWDNLIIIDACRYDVFHECNTLKGDLSKFKSRGSHTGEFMEQNFAGTAYPNTVYVSANPNPAEVNAGFAAVESVWDTAWDDKLHTVPPSAMADYTLQAHNNHPNKRLISHFIQPHYPWIGPKGREFMKEHGYRPLYKSDDIWLQMRAGDISKERVWEVYKENLKVLMPHLEELVDQLPGKTVITSDHGNAFGEWQIYGHPPGVYVPELVEVPWLEVPYSNRKTISENDSVESITEEVPEERLRDLGYI